MGVSVIKMEDVAELRTVLDRVAGRLFAASKMYGALNFAVWGAIMLLYYILGVFAGFGALFSVIYWAAAAAVAIMMTSMIWSRINRMGVDESHKADGRMMGFLIFSAWILGAVVGWWLIPATLASGPVMAVGFLSFIAISVCGMWLVMELHGAREKEMIPAFLVPVLGIGGVVYAPENAMLTAAMFVALGFMVTIIFYLFSAFRAIEG